MTAPAPRQPLSPGRRAAVGALLLLALGVILWRVLGPGSGPSGADEQARRRTEELLREQQTIPPPSTATDEMPANPPEPTRNPVGPG